MTKQPSYFYYLLIGFFMLSMLMPVVQADNVMMVGHEISQTDADCHSESSHANHDVTSHCASDKCHCTTACHSVAVMSLQPALAVNAYSHMRLSHSNAHLVEQDPNKFKRPPRS